MARPFIAAFDFATACGCADGVAGSDRPRLWSWYLTDAGEGRPPRLAYFRRYLDAYFGEQKVDEVVFEKPMGIAVIASMMAKGIFRTSEDVLLMLRGGIGVLEASASLAGVPVVRGIDIKDARKHLVGQRTFPDGTAKVATIRAATALGWAPENDNEADAAAIWSLACGQANPRMAAAMGRAHLAAKEAPAPRRNKAAPGAGPLFSERK